MKRFFSLFLISFIVSGGATVARATTPTVTTGSNEDQISITTPAANATWKVGDPYDIQWHGPQTLLPVKVNITLSQYIACLHANPACLIAEPQPITIGSAYLSDNKFTWTVPESAAFSTVQIHIESEDGGLFGTSGVFAISESGGLEMETLAVSTAASTKAVIGKSYMGTFYITGGTAPYQMKILAGQLPPGLSLEVNGTACILVVGYQCPPQTNSSYMIYGTPSKTGLYPLVFLATDANGVTTKKEFSITVYSRESDVPPTTEIKPGMVVMAAGSGTVYFITPEGSKYGFTSYEDFVSRGFTFSQVQKVDATSLGAIPETKVLERVGDISFRYAGKPAIYYLTRDKCKQVYPSMATLRAWGVSIEQVLTISETEQHDDCAKNFVQLPENTAVRLMLDNTVYVIRTGIRYPFATYEAFVKQGFTDRKVVIIPEHELGLYPLGGPITN